MANNTTVNILDRSVVKANGCILYTILSSDGINKYFATVVNGKVECECEGFYYRQSCRHATVIKSLEADLAAAEAGVRNDEKLEVWRASLYGIDARQAEETARAYRDIAWDDRY